MDKPFNELTVSEAERLHKLQEELGEALVAVSHVLLHGWESRHPDGGPTNRESLVNELGDVHSVSKLMMDSKDISRSAFNDRVVYKRPLVTRWMHHQGPLSAEVEALMAQRESAGLVGEHWPADKLSVDTLTSLGDQGLGVVTGETLHIDGVITKSGGWFANPIQGDTARYEYGDKPPLPKASTPTPLLRAMQGASTWTKDQIEALKQKLGL